MPKFIQSLDNQVYAELEKLAKERGITVQTLIRAVIVPEWSTLTGTEAKHEKVTLIEQDHPVHHTPHHSVPHPSPPSPPEPAQTLTSSTIFHLRHMKPSSFYDEAKQEAKTEKADIIVYGRKRRHH